MVEFRWPGAARIAPESGFVDESVIAFADLVARKVNGGHEPKHYSEEEAQLYGAGLREAELVFMSYVGNQFVTDHPNAAIEVRVVGRSEDSVNERRTALVEEVLATATRLQETVGTRKSQLISQSVQPLSWRIEHITPSRTTQFLAFGAIGVAGIIGGVGAALLWDRGAQRHRRRSRTGPERGPAHETR
ncbi:hypothetical protein [Microbacterium cremeum]|uniref:hypothetical protein n=1 Tax=Microbacterium cremeum TaxID=2782169 RepID=UPI0018896975|nr:hypothetical protein [Microbacterium cremeum]